MILEEFYGKDLDRKTCVKLAIAKIPRKLLECERDLATKKWADYRHLHPTIATYLFAEHYVIEYRRMYRRIFDVKTGMYRKGFTGKDIFVKDEKTGKGGSQCVAFWKGRQAADSLAMPYNLYIHFAMAELIEKSVWKRIPNPKQLYSDKVFVAVGNRWISHLSNITVEPATNLFVLDKNYRRVMEDVQIFLCQVLKMRAKPRYGLAHYMFEREIITEEIALKFFSRDEIKAAEKLSLKK